MAVAAAGFRQIRTAETMVRRLTDFNKCEPKPLEDCVGLALNLQSIGSESVARVSRLLKSVAIPRPNLSCSAMEDDNEPTVELKKDGSTMIVGSTVRAPLPDHPKVRRRAIIATIQEEEGAVCVFWEDEAPSSLLSADREMVISPSPSENDENPSVESTVKVSDVLPLLDFERHIFEDASVSEWKDRGDTLLRLGDASAAVPHYERALELLGSSPNKISIGSVVIVKQKGFFNLVQIDCIDRDEVDVTHLDEEEKEETLHLNDIVLAVPKRDGKLFQERILLNLARCFLQLAATTLIRRRRPSYLKAAVRAASFALTVSHFRDSMSATNFVSASKSKALLLRSQAQLGLSKFSHATGDAKKVLDMDPKNKEAALLLRDIARKQQKIAKADKKLVKEVCRWVQSATTESSVSEVRTIHAVENSETAGTKKFTSNEASSPLSSHNLSMSWLVALAVILLCWIVQKAIAATPR
jgi:tetratricopeptide (TPR) repeat protein